MKKDKFNKNCEDLKNKKVFLFDMDGTVYEEDRLFDGSLQLFKTIKKRSGKYIFITNNSSKSINEYIDKMKRLNIKVCKDNFYTSTQATINYIKNSFGNELIYCMGTKSLVNEFRNAGVNVTTDVNIDAKAVIVGFDTELTYDKIKKTSIMLKKDIPFIATNPDLRCPSKNGFIPDCGAICKLLECTVDRKPIYIGKPQSSMIEQIKNFVNCRYEEMVVIGDRLYTDIAIGINAGIDTICVLTGEATIEEIKQSSIKPTYVFDSIKDIYKVLIE